MYNICYRKYSKKEFVNRAFYNKCIFAKWGINKKWEKRN
jgi:hypothetical protein